jgi:hypothetical protein
MSYYSNKHDFVCGNAEHFENLECELGGHIIATHFQSAAHEKYNFLSFRNLLDLNSGMAVPIAGFFSYPIQDKLFLFSDKQDRTAGIHVGKVITRNPVLKGGSRG